MTSPTEFSRPARTSRRGKIWSRSSFALRAGIGAVVLAIALPTVQAGAEPPTALPFSGEGDDVRWQPAMDYDEDGCYPTPAIDSEGNVAEGLKTSGAINGSCHDESDLSNTNMYARSKTNNGWTAYMYDLYFEKDQTVHGSGGHRHDWEHIIVWVDDAEDEAKYVSTSAHDDYTTTPANEIEWEGDHPKIVYHKEGTPALTHAFRPATADDDPPENHDEAWQYPALVSWNQFPDGIRDILVEGDFDGTDMGIKDIAHDGTVQFNDELYKGKPEGIPFEPHACPCP